MANVEITLKTIDDTKSGFNSATQSVDKYARQVEGSLVPGLERARLSTGDFLSANAALIGVVVGVGVALKAAYDETIKYADQVRQLTTISGTSTEETSRFIQVLDDYKISSADALAATKALTANGHAPSIETLAMLSDQYLALNSVEEQNAFVLKNLGRNGLQWIEVLNKGSDAIREQGAAVNQSLILSQEQVDAARRSELAFDDLSDAWQGFQISLGTNAIPTVTNTLDELNNNISESGLGVGILRFGFDDLFRAVFQADKGIESADSTTVMYSDTLRDAAIQTENLAGATALTTEEIKAMSVANTAQFSLITRLQGINDDYNKTLEETTELYGENSDEVKRLEAEHTSAMKKIAFDLYLAKLQAQGFGEEQFNMAIAAGVAAGVIDQKTADMALAFDEAAQHAIDFGGYIDDVKVKANSLEGVYELEFHSTLTGQWPTTYTEVPDDFTGPLCFISGTKVWAGNEHKNIEDLQVGDFVRSYDTEAKELVDVSIAQIFRRKVSSYLLINGIGVTVEHPFFANGEWVKAGELKLGDVLLSEEGKEVFVTEISHVEKDATVYNIHTATEPHNYFAGGVLVHNKDAKMGASGGSPYAVQSGSMGMFSASDAAMIGQAVAAHIAPLLK